MNSPSDQKQCPFCAEPIKVDAVKCKHCGSVLTEEARDAFAEEIAERSDDKSHARDPVISDDEASARMVTVVFADITGFTALSEDHGPNEIREIMNTHFSNYVSIIERYGGEVDKYIGDEVMAVWGTGETREDDAFRACQAALEMVEQTRDEAERMEVPTDLHVGINTGRVVHGTVGSGQHTERTVMGDAVNLASRLCAVADAGRVLVGPETWSRVKDQLSGTQREFDLKGIGTTRSVELSSADKPMTEETEADSAFTDFVGRHDERQRLNELLSNFRAGEVERHGVLVEGERGTGKSRLCRHVLKQHTDSLNVCFSQCISSEVPALGGVIADWFQVLVDDSSHDDVETYLDANELSEYSRLLEVVLSEEMGRSSLQGEASEQAVDCLLEVASDEPLVLVVADLQWADGLSLEVIQQLTEELRVSGDVLVIAEGRTDPTLDPIRRAGTLDRIELNPLSRDELVGFMEEVFDQPPAEDWIESVREQTNGVILHVVQIFNALVEQGMIERVDGTGDYRLTNADRELPVPESLSDLIWARIDQLPPTEKETLLQASVCGFRFPEETIHLASPADRDEVERCVKQLRDRGFLVVGDDALSFQNRSIRETAREMILPKERRELANRILDELGERRRSRPFRSILGDLLRDAERYNELRELQSIQAYQHLRAFRKEEATELLDRAGEESWGDEPEAQKAKASYLNAKARLAEANSELEQALDHHREAVEILRDLDEPDDLAHGLILLSRMAVKCEKWELASEVTEESLEISRELDRTGAVAKATYMMGWLAEVQDDWETALEWYKETLDLEGREDGMGRAYSVSGIARAYEHLDREEDALPYHKESVEVMSHDEWMERNPHVYALNLESYGWNEWRLNHTAEGIDYMGRALDVALTTGDSPVVCSLLNRLVRVSAESGDDERAEYFAQCRDRYIDENGEDMGSFDPDSDMDHYEPDEIDELDISNKKIEKMLSEVQGSVEERFESVVRT